MHNKNRGCQGISFAEVAHFDGPTSSNRQVATEQPKWVNSAISGLKKLGLIDSETVKLKKYILTATTDKLRANAFGQFITYIFLTKYAQATKKQTQLLANHLPDIKNSFSDKSEYFNTVKVHLSDGKLDPSFQKELVDTGLMLPSRDPELTLDAIKSKAIQFDDLNDGEKEYIHHLAIKGMDSETTLIMNSLINDGYFSRDEISVDLIESGIQNAKDTIHHLAHLAAETEQRSSTASVLKGSGIRPSRTKRISESVVKDSYENKPYRLTALVDHILNKDTTREKKLASLIKELKTICITFSQTDADAYPDTMQVILDRHFRAGNIDTQMIQSLIDAGLAARPRDNANDITRDSFLTQPYQIGRIGEKEFQHVHKLLTARMSTDETALMETLIPTKYTRKEVLMCVIAKQQYNEDLSYTELFRLLDRGHDMVHTLRDQTPFQLRGDGEDVPAFMWYMKAKEGTEMCIKGSTGLSLKPGDSGRFLDKFVEGGAQPRISTHFSVTRIGNFEPNEGFGKDVPREELRQKTPFGLGSILIHPIVQRTEDLRTIRSIKTILETSDRNGYIALTLDTQLSVPASLMGSAITELEVAMQLQKAELIDFDLGVKFESNGYGDTRAQSLAHAGLPSPSLREDLLEKKSPELKGALTRFNLKKPFYAARREVIKELGADTYALVLQLADIIPGYGTTLIPQWKPAEGSLATRQISGGTYTELLDAAQFRITELSKPTADQTDSSEHTLTQLQTIRDILAKLDFQDSDGTLREGNEHRISVETGYKPLSRSASPALGMDRSPSSESDDIANHAKISLLLDPDGGSDGFGG